LQLPPAIPSDNGEHTKRDIVDIIYQTTHPPDNAPKAVSPNTSAKDV
jgi:hypothetical protein